MKRTNVVLDEKLLENARRASGEKTYSGTITKALEDMVRRQEFAKAYQRFSELVAAGDFFSPGYVEETWPEVAAKLKKRKISANEKRLGGRSGRKVATRGSR